MKMGSSKYKGIPMGTPVGPKHTPCEKKTNPSIHAKKRGHLCGVRSPWESLCEWSEHEEKSLTAFVGQLPV